MHVAQKLLNDIQVLALVIQMLVPYAYVNLNSTMDLKTGVGYNTHIILSILLSSDGR